MSAPLKTTPSLLWGFTFREGRASRLVNETCADQLAELHDWACSRSVIIAPAATFRDPLAPPRAQ